MTREEAIETIKDICLTTEQLTRIEKALECLLSQPSIPSNLDEAAEEYSRRLDYYHYTGDDPSIAFKAGAEWMAGQGVSMQITDDTEWEEVDSFIHKKVDGGSIIQIRKK